MLLWAWSNGPSEEGVNQFSALPIFMRMRKTENESTCSISD